LPGLVDFFVFWINSHPSRSEVSSHYGFDLHFPGN
jgi:hypothetical protein